MTALGTLLHAAYMVEKKSLEVILEHLDTVDHPEAERRIRSHLVETQWQIKLLEACLQFQGADIKVTDGQAQALARETEKTDLFDLKRFEISLYKKIITAARAQGASEVLQACREIVEQEREMAEWLEDYHPKLGLSFFKGMMGTDLYSAKTIS